MVWQQLYCKTRSRSFVMLPSVLRQFSVLFFPRSRGVQVDLYGLRRLLMIASIFNVLFCYLQTDNHMIRFIAILTLLTLTQSSLVITSPLVTDFPDNSIPYFYANFGEVTYGKTLSFDVRIMENGLCQKPEKYEQMKKPTYVVILTNYHETCSLTKRAEVAQLIGAKGIIIAADIVNYAKENVIEADDGNGKKVHITCLFITTDSYHSLKQLGKVEIIAKFPVPQAKVSTVSLFLSASKRSSYVFLRELGKEYPHLKSHINLEPIYQTISCQTCNAENCFLNFCCYDYENGLIGVGQNILREQIHQYNLYTQRGVQKWLTYMDLFDQYCDGDWNALEYCTQNIIKKMGIMDANILEPIDQILTTWKIREIKLGFDSFPEVAINGMVYRGNLEIQDIVITICESLVSPPKYCKQKMDKNAIQAPQSHKHVVSVLMATFLTLLIVVVIALCCYRHCIKSELTRDTASRVGEIIANYASNVSKQKKKSKQKMMETFEEEL